MGATHYISADEGFRGSIREPWTCGNLFCGSTWDNKPETWPCAGNHEVELCDKCVHVCRSCDQKYCEDCGDTVNWGDGLGFECCGCIKDAEENLERCTSCGNPRSDLRERESHDDSVGYQEIAKLCGECRK